MPAPTIMLMVRPTRSQRPIARTNLFCVSSSIEGSRQRLVRSKPSPLGVGRWNLKDQLESKLAHARSTFTEPWIAGRYIRRFADRAEGSTVEVNIRQTEICAIEEIEELGAELQRNKFRELRGFTYG